MHAVLANPGLPASQKLGVLPPWGWLVDLSPNWAFVVMLLISPVAIKFIIRPFWEGVLLTRRQEFMTFQLDILFAPALASGLTLVSRLEDRVYLTPYHPTHWIILLAAAALGVVHYLQERKFYSWRAMTALSKMYHELLFSFIGYALAVVGFFGIFYAPWTFDLIVMRIVMLGSLAVWGLTWPLYDEKHKLDAVGPNGENRYELAHRDDSHPWQHKYRHLVPSVRRYLADWIFTPSRVRAFFAHLLP